MKRLKPIARDVLTAGGAKSALEVEIVLENRYQLRRVRYSTLREPRLIKFKFSERVVRGAPAARRSWMAATIATRPWNIVGTVTIACTAVNERRNGQAAASTRSALWSSKSPTTR